ncbi:MAG: SET domain-containing protein-lysine N-methyltransferase [Pseudomonadota bacterium]
MSSVNFRLESRAVYVKDTGTVKGRGVFALRDFFVGEVVEECPVILFNLPFSALPEALKKSVFSWGVLVSAMKDSFALALGFGSLYNHDNPATMRYDADSNNLTLKFIAVRKIKAGEELTINYNAIGGGAYWHDDNWFERMKIQPITSS